MEKDINKTIQLLDWLGGSILDFIQTPFAREFIDATLIQLFNISTWKEKFRTLEDIKDWKYKIEDYDYPNASEKADLYEEMVDVIHDAYMFSPSLFYKLVTKETREYRETTINRFENVGSVLRIDTPPWGLQPKPNFFTDFYKPLGNIFTHAFLELSDDMDNLPENTSLKEIHAKAIKVFQGLMDLYHLYDVNELKSEVFADGEEHWELVNGIKILWGAFSEVCGKEKVKEVEAFLDELLPETDIWSGWWAVDSSESGKGWLEGFKKRRERQLQKE